MKEMRHNKFTFNEQTGVTLMEVLISLSILSIGLLSLLHYSASSVKELSENNPRSMALDVAADSMVQIYVAANSHDLAGVKSKIEQLSASPITKATYKVTVTPTSLKNGNGHQLLQADGTLSATTSWISPLSLGLKIQFLDHTNMAKNISISAPYTIVF
jgi:prepilin-type N-terminal cleavage/methylation domain-containing protein